MRSIGYLATVAFLLMTLPAAAEFVNEEWDDGDLGNWQAITGDQLSLEGATLAWGDGSLTVGENQTSISVGPRSAAIWIVE